MEVNPWRQRHEMSAERLVEEIPLGNPHNRDPYQKEEESLMHYILVIVSLVFFVFTLPVSIFMCVKVVKEYEKVVIFRLGRVPSRRASGPGVFLILPCTDHFAVVDMRSKSFDLQPQKILTKDSVTVRVDAVVYYRVIDAVQVVSNVFSYEESTQLLAATTLKTVLGTKILSEIVAESEHNSQIVQSSLDEVTLLWGIKVERVQIKDVRLPKEMQRVMAAEAEATREAKAKVIVAEGEHQASRVLKEAADVYAQSSEAMNLHLHHSLKCIAAEKHNRLMLSVPHHMGVE